MHREDSGISSTKQSFSFTRGSFKQKVLSLDAFGDVITMKFDGGKRSLHSFTGSILSILLFIILLTYTCFKIDTLVTKGKVDIVSAINENYYDEDFIFSAKQGFNIAVGVTDFGE